MKHIMLLGLLSVGMFKIAHAESPPIIDGWGKLKFGMSAQEAVKAMPEAELAIRQECKPENIIKKGCLLSPLTVAEKKFTVSGGSSYYRATIEGLQFDLTINFDRFNRLYQVNLNYNEQGVESGTCKKFMHRTIEGLEKRYGVLHSTKPTLAAEDAAKGYAKKEYTTSGGTTYHLTKSKDPHYLSLSTITNDPTAFAEYRANATSDNEENRASRSFFTITGAGGKESCSFWIHYTAATFDKPAENNSDDNAEF